MKKGLIKIIEVLCSGLLGVIITLGYQFFTDKHQSFTFIYDGNEITATESTYTDLINEKELLEKQNNNLVNQVSSLQAEIALLNSDLSSSQAEIMERQEELEQRDSDDVIKEFIQQIMELWDSGEYIQSLTLLKNSFRNSEDVQVLYKKYSDQYSETILAQCDPLIWEGKYEEAKDLITETQKIVYSNNKLDNKLSELDDYLSVKLNTMKVVMSRFWFIEDEEHAKDSVGNIYSIDNFYIMKADGVNNYGYATFYLNNQYTELTGTIAVSDRSENMGNNQMEGYIEMYTKVNDKYKKIYTSPTLSRMFSPLEISIDVSGYEWLEIRYYSVGDYKEDSYPYNTHSLYAILSDFALHSN